MTKIKLKPLAKKVHKTKKMAGERVYIDPNQRYYDEREAELKKMREEERTDRQMEKQGHMSREFRGKRNIPRTVRR